MPSHKPGTLVRVKKSAVERGSHWRLNTELTQKHGWLWIVQSFDTDTYRCRSVASGRIDLWLPHEITTRKSGG